MRRFPSHFVRFRLPRLAVPLTAGLALLALLRPDAAESLDRLHLQLDRSSPEADAAVESPPEIRLWFSQVPQAEATSMRLILNDQAVETEALEPDPDDAAVFAASIPGPLEPGSYTVAWRTMAADGHVVRGDFRFIVRAGR